MALSTYWELNPNHITEKDARLLEDDPRNAMVGVIAHEKGFLLKVPRWAMDDRLYALERSAFSDAFTNIIRRADKLEADWINLTEEVEVDPELPTFAEEDTQGELSF